jgi:hypothetical protein
VKGTSPYAWTLPVGPSVHSGKTEGRLDKAGAGKKQLREEEKEEEEGGEGRVLGREEP